MSAVERPTDGPDTELAAAEAWFRENPKAVDALALVDNAAPYQRYAATIVRAYLARPAAGRDLTADDVRLALVGMGYYPPVSDAHYAVVAYLNSIARPAVARTDGQPPADEPVKPRESALDVLRRIVLHSPTDGHRPQIRALLDAIEDLSAAPADDTAAPDPVAGYVLARVDDGTVTLWDDDVRTSRREVQIAHVEHVDDPPGAGWRCYELRDVCEPVRDSQTEATDG